MRTGFQRAAGRLWLVSAILPIAILLAACGNFAAAGSALQPAVPAASPPPLTKARLAPPPAAPSPSPAAIALKTAQGKPIRIGLLCDQTGPTAHIGTPYCAAIVDTITMLNETGGIAGRPVEVVVEDHVADPVTALDLWGRFVRRENISLAIVFGPEASRTIIPAAAGTGIPVLAFGFGPSAAVNGLTHPGAFFGSACPDCQSLALMEAMGEDWAAGNAGRPGRVVYLHDDSSIALDALGTVTDYAATFGLEPAGSLAATGEPAATADTVAALKEAGADFILVNVIGRSVGPLVRSARERGVGARFYAYPWAMSQDQFQDDNRATEGYRGLQLTALATDNPAALQELRAYWQARNVPVSRWTGHVFYDRGIAAGHLAIEALRLAADPDSGPSVTAGFEAIRDFTAGGYLPPITFSEADHGGTRAVKLSEIRDLRIVELSPWFSGPPPPGYPLLADEGW